MEIWLARPPLLDGDVQGVRHMVELFAAFGLTTLIGFADVLSTGKIVLDPSRVAAQIVSGISFLGAGIIITRRGAVHGLTTAVAVWESAAIGMAVGAGLLRLCGQRSWQLTELDADPHDIDDGEVAVTMTMSGARIADAPDAFADVDGVVAVVRADDEAD